MPALLDKVCLYAYAVEQAKGHLRGESALPEAFQRPRSPPWTRDELILALDLYFRHRPDKISKTHPEVLQLSEVLNELPLHETRAAATSFRNPSDVYMKLCNFLRLDPSYPGKGLESGSKADAEVWRRATEAPGEASARRHPIARLAAAQASSGPTQRRASSSAWWRRWSPITVATKKYPWS
ncbi:hypothetical protein [Nannocystis radixulma]|uniref:Uncharacterized protein n=1 Tax=Nannocystis radixulma TaxID=2995305 RepID=A0ABT5BLR0_9BACT|nr:hypothetical protein [Nannocystis radixulma]MDC0674515.1 hypothetical protein [Nannocystis radixulma]